VNAVPEAQITWDFEGGPVTSNSCFIQPFYKFYAEDEITEQGSELFVVDARKEDNGTYRCTAANVAGKSTSNFTLKVISVHKEAPPIANNSHFHIIVSSVGTLLLVTIIALFFILCLAYFHRKKPASSRTVEYKRTNVKPSEVGYEIIKLDAAETSSPCKTDISVRNPDLIINTEGTSGRSENCEQYLLLPGDIKQTYLTLTGTGTLLNTAVAYDGTAAVEADSLTATTNVVPPPSVAPSTGTIKLYLSPNPDQGVHNLYVNPFDSFGNSTEDNYWTVHLLKNSSCGDEQHVLINCCSQTQQQQQQQQQQHNAHLLAPVSRNTTLSDEAVNLRHNIEGYPYPSKLKLSPVGSNRDDEQPASTPILSPPDPFKTVSIGVDIENCK
jgi:hypothetical protein